MTKVLKMMELWALIQQPKEPGLVAPKPAWINRHGRICNVLKSLVNWDTFDEIQHHTNTSDE